MRAMWLAFLLLLMSLEASEAKWTRLLLEQMITNIEMRKTQKVYLADETIRGVIEASERFEIVPECIEADIVVDSRLEADGSCSEEKPTIVLSYRAFLKRGDAVGAFYWAKGRPTVIYLAPRLEKFQLQVTQKLQKYVVQEL